MSVRLGGERERLTSGGEEVDSLVQEPDLDADL